MEITAGLQQSTPYDQTLTLVAATARVLVFDLGAQGKDFGLAMRNPAAGTAIETTKIETGKSNDDSSYQVDTAAGTAIGSIAASAGPTGIATYRNNDCERFVRVTYTSAGGTSVRVQATVSS